MLWWKTCMPILPVLLVLVVAAVGGSVCRVTSFLRFVLSANVDA
ncbi:MAG: hypothetical protein KatS3mg113_0879 [Planctomycetaceae bacterium]|nr:MAG: hypothetical protein KatS3mg113_0879 [Planctomycetaceae bacterium]